MGVDVGFYLMRYALRYSYNFLKECLEDNLVGHFCAKDRPLGHFKASFSVSPREEGHDEYTWLSQSNSRVSLRRRRDTKMTLRRP